MPPPNTLSKDAANYVGHVFAPGFAKLLAKKSWFPDACERGAHCPMCPGWLEDYLTPRGFCYTKVREMLKNPAQHGNVCLLMHKFNDHMGMTMEHATTEEWGQEPGEECDFETDAILVGIVAEGKIVDQVFLPRNPALAVKEVDRVVELDLYDSLDRHWVP